MSAVEGCSNVKEENLMERHIPLIPSAMIMGIHHWVRCHCASTRFYAVLEMESRFLCLLGKHPTK